jgi:hypothetical protein
MSGRLLPKATQPNPRVAFDVNQDSLCRLLFVAVSTVSARLQAADAAVARQNVLDSALALPRGPG